MYTNNTFGTRLRKLRKEAGVTQESLAKHLGIAKANISRYESGKQKPEFKHLSEIAAHLQVNVADLFTEPMGILNTPQAHGFINGLVRDSKMEIRPTIPATLSHLSELIQALPPSEIESVSRLMMAFVFAPDSVHLRENLIVTLAGKVPTETTDFAGLPPQAEGGTNNPIPKQTEAAE